MTLQYAPTSSVSVAHEIHTDLRFNAIIDDPVIKTDRYMTLTFSDKREVSDTINRWEGSGVLSENCVMSGSTLLYVDTVRGVYIWRYEEQSLVATLDTFQMPPAWAGLAKFGTAGIMACFGRTPFVYQWELGGSYNSMQIFVFKTPVWQVECRETIFAITPKSTVKQTLVAEHTYHKTAFPDRAPGATIDPYAMVQEYGGNDFYYPEWCRAMLNDFVWGKAAQERVTTIQHPEWYATTPPPAVDTTAASKDFIASRNYLEDPTQIGALAFDTKDNFISSLVFNLHNPDNSVHRHIINDSSIGDVLAMIKSTATTYYPAGLI